MMKDAAGNIVCMKCFLGNHGHSPDYFWAIPYCQCDDLRCIVARAKHEEVLRQLKAYAEALHERMHNEKTV